MSQLKEQNGRYYQEVEVVMLATEKETNIGRDILTGDLLYTKDRGRYLSGYFLYFLSDDEIKKGDYVVETLTTGELEVFKIDTLNDIHNNGAQRKIIATTDKTVSLVQPSVSFIRKYIEEYNAGRQITKVLVEYVKHPVENYWYLHTDSDYEITITKLKDSYSRQEVIKLLNSAMIAAGNHGKRVQAYYMTDIGNPPLTPESFTNQWIEDNL